MANFELRFPLKGINKNWANTDQPPMTTPNCKNVRPRDVSEQRSRGGQRPGLDKWGNGDQIGGAAQPVVAILTIAAVT
jgi:hypothetical protein